MGRGLGRNEKDRRDELIGVVIHKCMETTQGYSQCSYLSQASKNSMFLFYYFFSSTKLENGRNRFCQEWLHQGK
jgi:hypothetical protein